MDLKLAKPVVLSPLISPAILPDATCHCSAACGAGAGGTCSCGSGCGGGAAV